MAEVGGSWLGTRCLLQRDRGLQNGFTTKTIGSEKDLSHAEGGETQSFEVILRPDS